MAHHREKSGRPQSGIQGPAVGLTSYCPARVTPIPREASSHGLAFAQQAPQPGVPFPLWPGETLHLTFAPAPLPASPAATLGSCGLRAYTVPLGNSIYRNCLSRKWLFFPQSFQLDSKFPEKAPPWGPCPSCNSIRHAILGYQVTSSPFTEKQMHTRQPTYGTSVASMKCCQAHL